MDTRAIQKWPEFTGFVGLDSKYIGKCFMCGKGLKRGESLLQGMGPFCAGNYNTEIINASIRPDMETYEAKLEQAGLKGCINSKAEPLDKLHALMHFLSRGLENNQAYLVCDAASALGFPSIAERARQKLKILPPPAPPKPDCVVDVFKHDKDGWQLYIHKNDKMYDLKEIFKSRVPCYHWYGHMSIWSCNATPNGARALIEFVTQNFDNPEINEAIFRLADQKDEPEPPKENTTEKGAIEKIPGGFIALTPYFDKDVYAEISSIPKTMRRWLSSHPNLYSTKGKPGGWFIQAEHVPQVMAAIQKVWPASDGSIVNDVKNEIKDQIAKAEIAKSLAGSVTCSEDEIIVLPGGKTYMFQSIGIRFAELYKRVLIADSMGLGKTVQALGFLRLPDRRPALIVCPSSVKLNWARQIRLWLGDRVSVSVVQGNYTYPVDSSGLKTRKNGTVENTAEPDFLIINYDVLRRHSRALMAKHFETVVFDESHYLKESRSARSKAAAEISKAIDNRLLLTGTPILNRPKELWHQLHILDPHKWPDFFDFAFKYCDPQQIHVGRGKKVWSFNGHANIEELNNILTERYMIRRKKEQVLTDMPEKRVWNTLLDVKPEHRESYEAAEKDFKTWLLDNKDGDKIAAAARAEALVKMTTLRRLVVNAKTNAAVEYVSEWLDSNEDPCIVWGHHVDALTSVYSRLAQEGHEVVKIFGGGMNDNKKQDAIKAIAERKARVLVAGITAAGTGVDRLQESVNHAFFLERTWRPADLAQAEDRIHRIGQGKRVSIEYLDMPNSMDIPTAEMIKEKEKVFNATIDGEGIDTLAADAIVQAWD